MTARELRDWDLWPGIVAYESPAGHIERMRRSFVALTAAMKRTQAAFAATTVSVKVLLNALRPTSTREENL